jgi:hypothetical protein
MSSKKAFEAKISNWSNTMRGGPRITLDLCDDIDLDELKPLLGLGLYVCVMLDDELQEEQKQKLPEYIEPVKPAVKGLRKLSQEAHLMIQEPNFWAWMNKVYQTIASNPADADYGLKEIYGIKSKSELDDENRPQLQRDFLQDRNDYRKWVNGGMK